MKYSNLTESLLHEENSITASHKQTFYLGQWLECFIAKQVIWVQSLVKSFFFCFVELI